MTSTLPPDPYIALGVAKDANLAEIRSAHRKLVLKCHPDKVQDAALKAIKQDEFQKVQQAYELLSDDTKRLRYDEQVKLFELRKEMGRGNPTARSNPFEYEIRTAEPRTTSTTYTTRPSPKVYSHPPPRSYEDVMYEEPPRGVPRKTASYETDRKRTSAREEERERDRRRYHDEEEERVRRKAEKESKRYEHGKEKKNRDKERRKGTEEKIRTRTTAAYVQSDDSDDYRSPRLSEKKSQRHKMEEDIRQREDAARAARAHHPAREREREPPSIKSAPLDPKWDGHMSFAGEYMQAARRKVCVDDSIQHPGIRRADTFTSTTATYNVRHVAPQQYSDDDSPRRSSARRETTRRTSDTPQVRTREKSAKPSSRRSPVRDPYIVEPPSPPPMMKKPPLQTHSSAPPNIAATYAREKPSRSKTQEYPRQEPIPTMPRAQTFNVGDRGSRLKNQFDYSSDSDPDSPVQPTARYSHSPPRRVVPEPTRYIIDNGRSVPITKARHRSELRNISTEHDYRRERSQSPGTRHTPERSPMARNSSDRPHAIPTRSQSHNYYTPDPPKPVVLTARPKGSPREGSHRSTRGGPGPYFEEVTYAPQYRQEHVIYSAHPPADVYRRGSDPSHHRDYYPSARGGGEEIYAS